MALLFVVVHREAELGSAEKLQHFAMSVRLFVSEVTVFLPQEPPFRRYEV
jgi:hypothetical protein